jgi:hypothetical protein
VWTTDKHGLTSKCREPLIAEAEAIKDLRGVGSDDEWWYWNPELRIGHVRVGLTPAEAATLTPRPVFDDAGESGPLRKRRKRR